MRHKEIVAARMRRSAGCERLGTDSRQRSAARTREKFMGEVNKLYGPEPRKARRGIALALARKNRVRAV